MIEFLRKGLGSWVVLGILGLVVAAFVITGVQDPFGGSSGGGAVLAKVGRDKISSAMLNEELQRKVRQLQQQNPELTMDQVVQGGGVQGILDGLTGRIALEHFMGSAGISGGPKAVADIIAKETAFQLGGVFNKKLYEDMLRQQKLSQSVYERQMTADIGRAQLLGSISRGWSLPDSVVLAYANLLEEQRVAQIAIIPGSRMGAPTVPDDKTLAAFYDKNKADYRAPELRSFRSFVLEPTLLTAKVTVSDAEIQAYVTKNAKDLGAAETRNIQQITLDSKEAADALVAKVKAGADFTQAAKTAVPGLTDEDLTRANVTQAELANDIGAAPAASIFKLPRGGMTAATETDIGWQLFRIAEITAGKGAALDGATRAKATAALQSDKAIELLYKLTEKIDDAASKRKSFDDLAKLAGVVPTSVGPVSNRGADASGQPVPGAQSAMQTLQLAFNHRPGDDLSLETIGENSFALVEVTKVTPAAPRPLADIKPIVVAEWQRDMLNAKAKATAEKIAADMRAGKAMAVAATGFPVQANFALRRADLSQLGQKPPEALTAMFKTRQGDVVVVDGPNGNGYAIVQITAVKAGAATKDSPVYAGLKQSIMQYGNMEAQAQFVTATKSIAKVDINQPLLKQFTQQLLGK